MFCKLCFPPKSTRKREGILSRGRNLCMTFYSHIYPVGGSSARLPRLKGWNALLVSGCWLVGKWKMKWPNKGLVGGATFASAQDSLNE